MSFMLVNFPKEQALLGKILTGYSDMEYLLAYCVGAALEDDAMAVRLLFRLRGETQRIQAADSIMRPRYEAAQLKSQYEAALGAMRFVTTIRNQYAHCHWLNAKEAGLYFSNLEKAANTCEGDLMYLMRHIDVTLLQKQHAYLRYCTDWLFFLPSEYKLRAGKISNHDRKAPKIIDKPPLHNPPEEHPLPNLTKDETTPQAPPPEEAEKD